MYKVRFLQDQKFYALKAIEKRSDNEEENQRLRSAVKREADLQMNVKHAGVVSVKSMFEDKSNFYLVLEYCENGDLYRIFGPEFDYFTSD